MTKKKAKAINPKDTQKALVKAKISEVLADCGEILDGKDFGFTKDTTVLRTEVCDVQIKLITPKTGLLRYENDDDENE